MSREGAGSGKSKDSGSSSGGTSMWFGVLYFLGAIGAVLLGFLVVLRVAAALFWDDAPSYDPSVPIIVLWAALVVLAIGTWVTQRRRR